MEALDKKLQKIEAHLSKMSIGWIERMELRLDACCIQSLNTATTSNENSNRIVILEMAVEELKEKEANREKVFDTQTLQNKMTT